MQVQYYKDLKHNYLILECEDQTAIGQYPYKMITSNRIQKLLPCSLRHMDGNTYLYYEISSRQNMKTLFEGRAMDYRQLQEFCSSLVSVIEEIDEYLLEEQQIVLAPEYIYYEFETNQFRFLYYPDAIQEEWSFEGIFEYIIGVINHEQAQTADIAYQIAEAAQNGQLLITELMRYFQEAVYKEHPEDEIQTDQSLEIEKAQIVDEIAGELSQVPKYNKRTPLFLLFLCLASIGGLLYLRNTYLLSAREELLSLAGIVALAMLAAGMTGYLLYCIIAPWKKDKEQSKEREPEQEYTSYYPTWDTEIAGVASSTTSRKEVEYGNTVFVPVNQKYEHKLYGTSKGNKYQIDLSNLPCTVGKLAGHVNLVMNETTISRLHARFDRREEQIMMSDLNSTNGTYKNGLRLMPNETIVIEPGDEVKLGNFTFIYR